MLADPIDASPRQAAEALDEHARLRRRTRRSLGAPWFPLVCFGALTMLSAPLVAAAGTSGCWLSATRAGRTALNAEIAALREIIAGLETPPVRRRVHRSLTQPS